MENSRLLLCDGFVRDELLQQVVDYFWWHRKVLRDRFSSFCIGVAHATDLSTAHMRLLSVFAKDFAFGVADGLESERWIPE